ncbi:MAG: hypothetical protein ACOCTT_04355 [archaeon]
MSNNNFVDGIWIKEADKAPDFVKYSLLVDVKQFVECMKKHMDTQGKVKIDIKESKKGNHYMQVNDFDGGNSEPEHEGESIPTVEDEDDLDVGDIPF